VVVDISWQVSRSIESGLNVAIRALKLGPSTEPQAQHIAPWATVRARLPAGIAHAPTTRKVQHTRRRLHIHGERSRGPAAPTSEASPQTDESRCVRRSVSAGRTRLGTIGSMP